MTIREAWRSKGSVSLRLQLVLKRLLDIAVGGGALLASAPLIAVIAVLVRVRLGSPVLFRQERLGFQGRPFELTKFRSMSVAHDSDGRPLPDSERLTLFGRSLRGHALDELPSFANVLRGDMSLVGPRPLLVEYESLYSVEQARRHSMPPGMTGPVIIAGRNVLSWEEKFQLDLTYMDDWSFALDLKILFLTGLAVLTARGASASNHSTMPKFRGASVSDEDDRSAVSSPDRIPERDRL